MSLLYAPYQIALGMFIWHGSNFCFINNTTTTKLCCYFVIAALHIAAAVLNKDLKTWFAELSVDMDKVENIS